MIFLTKLGVIIVLLFSCSTYGVLTRKVNFILLGSTGDLAKKYLWQSFFNLFHDLQDVADDGLFNRIEVFGTGRGSREAAFIQVSEILENSIRCQSFHSSNCQDKLANFRERITYVQLKTDSQYATLCSNSNLIDEEIGRVFFLSIPPFAYSAAIKNINKHCRPSYPTWLRVVFEKPFGKDYTSAMHLAKELQSELKENEIYPIDHYLGKPLMNEIHSFRAINEAHLDPLWNSKEIYKIEVAMKEVTNVAGRGAFYDQYGVIRDVHQNHMMEMFAAVAMTVTPLDETDFSRATRVAKLSLFQSIQTVTLVDTLVAQYLGYKEALKLEMKTSEHSKTPTFASILLRLNSSQWEKVPVVFLSGKLMSERASYVRVSFKGECEHGNNNDGDDSLLCNRPTILFLVQSSSIPSSIIVSSHFKNLLHTEGFLPAKLISIKGRFDIPEDSTEEFFAFETTETMDAYTSLMWAVARGQRHRFVSLETLLESWRIFTSVLSELPSRDVPIYSSPDDLSFSVSSGGLHFNARKVDHNLRYVEL